jgi:hypothetical protein
MTFVGVVKFSNGGIKCAESIALSSVPINLARANLISSVGLQSGEPSLLFMRQPDVAHFDFFEGPAIIVITDILMHHTGDSGLGAIISEAHGGHWCDGRAVVGAS